MSDINIKELRKKMGVSQEKLAEILGVHHRTIQNYENGGVIPKAKCAILRNLYDGANADSTNEEPILKETPLYYGGMNESTGKSFPLIPIEAVAGFPDDDNDGITYADCEQYTVPEFEKCGCEFVIRVSGSSMYPKYSNGDVLACKKIKDILFFQWGKVYVIDSSQGALVKRVFEDTGNPDNILLVSDNKENYPPFSMPKNDIRSLSIVLGVIRME